MSEEMIPKCGLRTRPRAESQALPEVCLFRICFYQDPQLFMCPLKFKKHRSRLSEARQ